MLNFTIDDFGIDGIYKNTVTFHSEQFIKKVSVSGHVRKDGTIWENFQGSVLVRVLDSKKKKSYVTEKNTTVSYYLPGNSIFRGVVQVTDGRFNVEFIDAAEVGELGW